ncbi:hypothetical protein D3C73_1549510 [compost metagenome]
MLMQRCLVRSSGRFGLACLAKYSGVATAAIRNLGLIGIAIMSRSMVSPMRTPASKRSATMSRNP